MEPKAEIYSDLGFVLDQLGRRGEAVECYKKALDLNPQCGPAHFNLAVALVGEGKLEEAVRELREALRVDPGNAEAHRNLRAILARQGQSGAARDE